MFPILPTTGMQVEARCDGYACDDEEARAQRFGRVVHAFSWQGRGSRARLILLTLGLIITVAVVPFFA
jgi:type II secretory pathway component PulM